MANGRLQRFLADKASWPRTIRLRGGVQIAAINDYVGRTALFVGDLDPKISWVLRRALRPGDCVVDVGANIGVISLTAARLVGPSGYVYAFEPQPEVAKMLMNSASMNNFAHVHVHQLALSDANGTLPLSIPADNRGAASVEPDWPHRGPTIDVPVRQASEYLTALDLPHVRVLKIDIEGHEATFLAGAASYILGDQPDLILIEEQHRPASTTPSIQFLLGAGYSVFGLPRAKFVVRPQRLDEKNDSSFHDFIAIRTDAKSLQEALGCL